MVNYIKNIKRIFTGKSSKFIFLKKSFQHRPFTLLDVGAGNHSAYKTKTFFPNCAYFGLDQSKYYNNSEEDFSCMAGFYEMDLTELDFQKIPDNFFDAIWIVHVIEHLYNGDKVIEGIIAKLKKNGFMYVEYPGIRSKKLPSMHGTLNFYDDPTHVRLYSVQELGNLFHKHGFTIVQSGVRRNIFFILAMPFRIIASLLKRKKLQGNIFWDITGFAEYLYVQKK